MAATAIHRPGIGWWGGVGLIVRRELRDTFRDWRMITPIVLLTLFFPVLMTITAGAALSFVNRYGTPLIGERLIPFLLLIVGFFPMSFSLVIALEAFVGERERKSLEPLLATPLTDGQLYLGKMLASMIPALMAAYLGIGVYLVGLFLFRRYAPAPALLAQVVLLTTFEGVVMVSGAVVVSSRATSVRAANLLASFIIVPMALLVQVESLIMFWAIYDVLWGIAIGLIVVALILTRMGVQLFNREELLGREIDSISLRGIGRRLKHDWLTVEPDQAAQRFSLIKMYRYHIPAALRRTRHALVAVLAALAAIAIAAWSLAGQNSLPEGLVNFSGLRPEMFAESAPTVMLPSFSWHAVLWNNVRSLLLGGVLGLFSFGSLAVVLLMAPVGIVAFAAALVSNSGYSPLTFLVAFILPHGIFELPAAIIATAAALRLGAAVLHRSPTMTMGEAWWLALADFVKLFVFVVLPLLAVAAFVEVFVTPRILCAMYGCGG